MEIVTLILLLILVLIIITFLFCLSAPLANPIEDLIWLFTRPSYYFKKWTCNHKWEYKNHLILNTYQFCIKCKIEK